MARGFLVPLLLPADPTTALQAATKQYVDAVGGLVISATAPADTTKLWADTTQVGIEENARYITNITAAAYSFVLSDRGKFIEFNSASAQTATVQPDATTNFVTGTQIDVVQMGVGLLTIAAGSGVTLRFTPTNKLRAQNSSASLVKRAANDWWLVGDMSLT